MNVKEVKSLLPRYQETAGKYTDVFLVLSNIDTNAKGAKRANIGSCLHLSYNGKEFTVTCDHVAKKNSDFLTSPKKTGRDILQSDLTAYSRDLLEIARSESLDLALFQHDSDTGQNLPVHRYDLSDSSILSVKSNLVECLSYIHGVWGETSPMYQHPVCGLLDHFIQLYTGFGPVTEVRVDEVIADFAEKDFVEEPSEDVRERIPSFELTGGVRDISGCSGSGLWVKGQDRVFLLGVMLGRKCSTSDQHLIRFTPVWKLIEFVEDIFDKLK